MARDRSRRKPLQRKENTREERKSTAIKELLTFSFRCLDERQPKNLPQTIEVWNKEGLLEPAMVRLKELSNLSRDEAVSQGQIKIYGDFPPDDKTDFFHPEHVDYNVAWSVIKKIGGQKATIAGYIVENTFYVVFLDKNHRFWVSEKKKT